MGNISCSFRKKHKPDSSSKQQSVTFPHHFGNGKHLQRLAWQVKIAERIGGIIILGQSQQRTNPHGPLTVGIQAAYMAVHDGCPIVYIMVICLDRIAVVPIQTVACPYPDFIVYILYYAPYCVL